MHIFDNFGDYNGGLYFLGKYANVLAGICWIGLLYFFNGPDSSGKPVGPPRRTVAPGGVELMTSVSAPPPVEVGFTGVTGVAVAASAGGAALAASGFVSATSVASGSFRIA